MSAEQRGPSVCNVSIIRKARTNDSTLTSAILDRVLHHADTVIIEGKSFRMKDEIDE
jgi:DNA replication protein DnaC